MKPILFIDWDGTLCFDRFWRSSNQKIVEHIQEFLFTQNNTMVNDWMKGKFSSEEINRLVADEIGIGYEELFQIFIQDCETMKVQPKIFEKIAALRERFTTVLMTDNMDCFSRFTSPALQLNRYFDRVVNSSAEKRLKREYNGKSFKDIADMFGSDIRKSILIDDSEETCRLFESLGGQSMQVNSPKDTSFHLDSIR
jgi:FMN phosphatase YigB (HAD superfamily)